MNHREDNEILNALLVAHGRSLLQYMAEAWPWTNEAAADLHDEVKALAERQSQAANAIAELLADRNWRIDFGNYPVDYTHLNYVGLEHLLREIVTNAETLVTEIREKRPLINEPEASALLGRIEEEQQAITARLRKLAENADS